MTTIPKGWFEAAVNPEHVLAHLGRDVSEFATGRLGLLGCRVTRLRSAEPEGHWTATYLLDVEDRVGGARRTVVAGGRLVPPTFAEPAVLNAETPFGADGWHGWLPALRLELRTEARDAALPALATLGDPDAAAALLEHLLSRDAGRGEHRLASCTREVTSYKPGVRATLRCDLHYPPGAAPPGWPPAVIVKLHHGDAAERCHGALEALWASPLGSGGAIRIAEPLAYEPGLGLSVQTLLAEEQTLRDLLGAALVAQPPAVPTELAAALRTTGAGLAQLHRCGIDYGEVVTYDDELATLRRKHQKLASSVPWLDERTGVALDRLAAAGAATSPDRLAPAHHSFRPAQVLLSAAGVAFIDFDKLCRAEPAADLASFTTKVRHIALNKLDDQTVPDPATREQRLACGEEMCACFREGYARHATVSPRRLAAWEGLELFALVLSAAKKALRDRVEDHLLTLDRHLAASSW